MANRDMLRFGPFPMRCWRGLFRDDRRSFMGDPFTSFPPFPFPPDPDIAANAAITPGGSAGRFWLGLNNEHLFSVSHVPPWRLCSRHVGNQRALRATRFIHHRRHVCPVRNRAVMGKNGGEAVLAHEIRKHQQRTGMNGAGMIQELRPGGELMALAISQPETPTRSDLQDQFMAFCSGNPATPRQRG